MSSETGKKFGPYEILGELGGGGMGMVYRAYDPRLHREVALKVLRSQYERSSLRERFLREARAVSALNHPNICTVFDIGEQDGEPYLVMELLHGETLRERLEREALSTAEIVDAGMHIADALAEAHSKGIIHRDIKPANIFLVKKKAAYPQVKVLDFGLAKIQGESDSFERENLTGMGDTVGTVAYMSPEQARGDELDARSDLFSFGAMLYEMATGQIPFTGATSAMVFVALLGTEPAPVRDWNPSIPRELERVILKALAKELRLRYQSADEMRDALNAVIGSAGGQGRFSRPRVLLEMEERAVDLAGGFAGDLAAGTGDAISEEKRQISGQSDAAAGVAVSASDGSGSAPAADPAGTSSEAFLQRGSGPSLAVIESPWSRSLRLAGSKAGDAGGELDSEAVSDESAGTAWDKIAGADGGEGAGRDWGEGAGNGLAIDPDATLLARVAAGEDGGTGGRFVGAEMAAAGRRIGRIRRGNRQVGNRRRWLLVGAGVALAAAGGMGAYLLSGGRLRRAPLGSGDQVLVAAMNNRTGDPLLEGTLREAVLMELRQSPMLDVLSDESMVNRGRLAQGSVAGPLSQRAAASMARQQRIKAVLEGSVSRPGAGAASGSEAGKGPYTIELETVNGETGAVLARVSVSAVDQNQLLDAAGAAADEMRVRLGEARDAVNRQRIPLTQQTTSSLQAFHGFAEGNQALARGDAQVAIGQYRLAVALDPKFALACAQLAKAEAEMLDVDRAAGRARQASDLGAALSDRDRMYLDAEFNLIGNRDLAKAAEEVEERARQYTDDSAAPAVLAAIDNAMGRFTDADVTARVAMAADSYETAGYAQEQRALIGMDRYEAAENVQDEARKHGVKLEGFDAVLAFLSGRKDDLAQDAALAITPAASYRERANYALILDETGQFEAGAFQWQALATDAEAAKLNGTAGYVLAQGAMDRALAGQCEGTLGMAGEAEALAQDSTSLFHVAMAAALCGDATVAQGIVEQFGRPDARGTLVSGFYVPDIQGAMALKSGDAEKALSQLDGARAYDLISPTPYLRGLAHLAAGQPQVALGDFQRVLAHRGASLLSGDIDSSLAQAGIGKAYGAIGDARNSADAYRKFLEDWQGANRRLPLVVEAAKDSR